MLPLNKDSLRKVRVYIKENYVDFVTDFFVLLIFEIVTGIFFIRLLLKQLIKTTSKELGKNVVTDNMKKAVQKIIRR